MRKWLVKLERWMNNYKLNKKLLFLYVVCVLLPLIVTDSVVIYIALHTEEVKQQHMMENDVNAVQFSFSNSIESAASVVKAVDTNEYIDNFLNEKYESSLSYFVACNKAKNLLFNNNIGGDSSRMTIYADNETITNGGKFSRLSSIKDEEWYQYMVQTGCNTCVYTYYDQSRSPVVGAKRKILFLRRMNCYGPGCEKVVKIELDYSALVRGLVKMNYESPIYICSDGKILYSNDGKSSSTGMDFLPFIYEDQVGYEKEMTVYGKTLQIYALKSKANIVDSMLQNAPLILLLVLINAVFPLTFMVAINRSLTTRIRELGQAFESVDQDRLVSIACVRGKDEIGALMQNYNRMVDRTNELIQTVYKDRLKKQEMDIARQHAELLALHSQINPHSLAEYLGSLGYETYAQHPYYASGWDREKVYPLLGFSDMDFIDDYENKSYVRKYVSDASDFSHVIRTFENKKEGSPAFIFNVTMQNHGGYTEEYRNFSNDVEADCGTDALNQYLSLIRLTDESLRELIQYFSEVDEKTLIVFFGDHQPSDTVVRPIQLANGIDPSNLTEAEQAARYQVPYLIWANFGIAEEKNLDMSVNYLGANVLKLAGVPTGAYQNFLLELQKSYPILSASLMESADVKEEEQKERLLMYQKLQYYNIFDAGEP